MSEYSGIGLYLGPSPKVFNTKDEVLSYSLSNPSWVDIYDNNSCLFIQVGDTLSDSVFLRRYKNEWVSTLGSIPQPVDIYYSENLPISSTTSSLFQDKVTLTLPNDFEEGNYLIEVYYGWNHSSLVTDFESRLRLDGVDLGTRTHRQEPKDRGVEQSYPIFRRFYKSSMPAGSHTITLEWRSATGNGTSDIWDASITVIKVEVQE